MLKMPFKDPRAFAISTGIFTLIMLAGAYFINLSNLNFIQNQRLFLSGLARSQASEIERSLNLSFTSTQILAHQIALDQNKVTYFDSYAKKIIQSFPSISNIQLAPNGVIQYIYPLKGNESAIGLDILNHPQYREASALAIKGKKMIAIGPVKLVQGGVAVISRTPIFQVVDEKENGPFWGFASALIMLDPLLSTTGIHRLESEGYSIKLERENIDLNQTLVFYESPLSMDEEAIAKADIALPNGKWTLSLSHDVSGNIWTRTSNMLLLTILLAAVSSLSLYNILVRPIALQKEVDKKTQELKELAYKDPLTELPNRRFLNENFDTLVQKIEQDKKVGAFIYFDLDNFKAINDSIGHDVGDQVLIQIAHRLKTTIPPEDIVIRLGGDEFAIIITDTENELQVTERARTILHSTQKILQIEHREFKQSTSLGIALIPGHGSELLELMQCADVALYEAKRRGKNQFVVFDEAMRKSSIQMHNEEMALAKAIDENQLVLHFQPQFDLKLNKVIGAEALVRWQHPEKGLVYPDQFIPLAEQSGQILELGNRVIEMSFQYLAKRHELGLYPILLHINLSSLQLSDPKLVNYVRSMVRHYQVPGHYIGFEITETTLLTDIDQARKTLEQLKAMGMCIAIDDFGTGYSSLGQLKNLPVDLLKVDRSFIWDLEKDKDDRMMVEAIIAMAHKLNISVIAEGVETHDQLLMLQAFHCDLGQGYLVSKPIPADEFDDFPESLS